MKEGSLPSTRPTLSCVPGWMTWTRLYPSVLKHEVIALKNEIHALCLALQDFTIAADKG